MPPQLPEHVVVTLLRHFYTTPRCQATRTRPQCLPNSFTRALSSITSSPCPRHRRPAQLNTPPRRPGAPAGWRGDSQLISRAQFSGLSSAQEQEAVAFAAAQNGQGGERPETRIAVLGGGITGLSTAHYLTKELPNAKITVYEGGDRLGGWLKSKYVDVGSGKVLFEQGPRTLRPNSPPGLVTLDMIKDLGLTNQLLITYNDSVAARNRYVYYPDRLVRMPGPGQDMYSMAWTLLTEPIFKGLFWGILGETNRPTRPDGLEDESVGSFLERRTGTPHIGDNIVSAVLHGIYAGDIYKLSIKSLLPMMWNLESWRGNISNAVLARMSEKLDLVNKKDMDLKNEMMPRVGEEMISAMQPASVYSFKTGIGILPEAVQASLSPNPNVEFKLGNMITDVEYDGEKDSMRIKTAKNSTPESYTKVISTFSSSLLSSLVPNNALPTLGQTPSVTVMVVNLFYPDPHLLPEQGFGYLIPRSIAYEQNPECALGVVFDSDAVQGQDTASGTKVTVMMGGHWWDGYEAYPDEEEGAAMAQAVLARHLKVTAKPTAVQVGLQRNCIPQYTVGHESRMAEAHTDLMREFRGKLAVAGNSYTGVGLNDCVRGARDVVMGFKRGDEQTGLGHLAKRDQWVQVKMPSKEQIAEAVKKRYGGPPSAS